MLINKTQNETHLTENLQQNICITWQEQTSEVNKTKGLNTKAKQIIEIKKQVQQIINPMKKQGNELKTRKQN